MRDSHQALVGCEWNFVGARVQDGWDDASGEELAAVIARDFAVDHLMSQGVCDLALKEGEDDYLRGAPRLYNERAHLKRVQRVVATFRRSVTGPAVTGYAKLLEKRLRAPTPLN